MHLIRSDRNGERQIQFRLFAWFNDNFFFESAAAQRLPKFLIYGLGSCTKDDLSLSV